MAANTEKNRSAGFTLIEMMTTVAIIGLLATISIPAFQNYQNRSKRSEAMTNVQSIVRAEQTYSTEYNQLSPITTPHPGGGLGPTKRPWTPAADADFQAIGWRPEGDVYFDYEVNTGGPACVGCFTVTAYGDVDGDVALSLVQYVQPTVDLSTWVTSVIEPAAGIPMNGGSPLFNQVVVNTAADEY
jgi:prepilin-type N-terminal cleavage/methylation domain-containing protein